MTDISFNPIREIRFSQKFPNIQYLQAVCDQVSLNPVSSATETSCDIENLHVIGSAVRVKSGKFGRSAKFGQRPCLFHILIIGIKNKLTKQTVKIHMRW